MGETAFAVVGEDHDIAVGQALGELGQLGLQYLVRRRVFEIDTQQLLLTTDDAQLDRRIELGVLMQAGVDSRRRQ